jgi:hypothetical protein
MTVVSTSLDDRDPATQRFLLIRLLYRQYIEFPLDFARLNAIPTISKTQTSVI